jgi:hypothetical protein
MTGPLVGEETKLKTVHVSGLMYDREAPEDNWRHRARNMRCRSCMWWVPKKPQVENARYRLGRCRQHAPTLKGWPATFPDDWCGDHKLDEERIDA